MNNIHFPLAIILLLITNVTTLAQSSDTSKYILEHDREVAQEQPGPHNGGGTSIGYGFFENVKNYKTAFRKRVLKPGSSIGYHFQEVDEIYYIIEGKGTMQMNGESFEVQAGDAILTRARSSHGVSPLGEADLVIIIVYEKK